MTTGSIFCTSHLEAHTMITLTPAATTKVAQLIEAEGEDDLALRVAVRPGGCSGFAYEMFFDSDVAEDDVTMSYNTDGDATDGDATGSVAQATRIVRVVVDPSSAQLLHGATLDYKDGLDQSGFAITNPNAQRTCGCGQSFS
ncbi:MAG: iron-sulfur cluster insertion protein ErpA [Actinobacteria bacterium]|nr:iron-sulfur cluster insertion protein ErpA [Actinomycetota bacterium]